MRAAARSVIVSRCVRGIDLRGLHKTNLEALGPPCWAWRCPGRVCLVDGFNVPAFGFEQRAVIDGDCRSAAIAAASVLAKVTPRPLHAPRRRAPPGLGLRDERRLLDARAPRRDRAERRLAAAPDVVPVDRLQAARARQLDAALSERVLEVLEGEQPPAGGRAHADGVEAHARAGRGPVAPRWRSHCAPSSGPGAACAARSRRAGPERGRRAAPATRVLTSQNTRQRRSARDEVELAVAGPEVPLDDLVARAPRDGRGELLAEGTESPPWVVAMAATR